MDSEKVHNIELYDIELRRTSVLYLMHYNQTDEVGLYKIICSLIKFIPFMHTIVHVWNMFPLLWHQNS